MLYDHALHSIFIFTVFHAYIPFLSLSLSLSQIDYTWYPSANLLQSGTIFVRDHLLLILLFPFFTFSSLIRRPIRTSLRTFLNVAFIRSATWFCRTLKTLLYSISFTLGDRILFMRYPWDVPPCSFRSFTPICMVSISLYLSLSRHSEVRSHSRSYIRDTSCPVGIVPWLPRLSAFEDYVQRCTSVSLLWNGLHMG